jgi:hypothetical protein
LHPFLISRLTHEWLRGEEKDSMQIWHLIIKHSNIVAIATIWRRPARWTHQHPRCGSISRLCAMYGRSINIAML